MKGLEQFYFFIAYGSVIVLALGIYFDAPRADEKDTWDY